MRKILTLIILFFSLINCNAQTELAGKVYVAEVGATCKAMIDGGCMIYTYRILEFNQDSVTISYHVKASCTPKERENGYNHMYDNLKKTYNCEVRNQILTIENCSEISQLTVQQRKIIGRDNERKVQIIFTEEPGIKERK